MAELRPFRGLRYRTANDDLSAVIAPPYDVISPAQQQALYERGPHNVIRLEYSREEAPARYATAARDLVAWRGEQGVLALEAEPALYRYVQRFTHGGRQYERTALFGRVTLEPIESGVIRPHEYTMSRPKEDRLALLRATKTNISPVFSLLQDSSHEFREALAAAPAVASAAGEDITGQSHRIEVITDTATLAALTDAVAGRPLYIADGHHRYETALAYQAEQPDAPAAGSVLMAIAAADDPGLLILPIHRIVKPSATITNLEVWLAETFELTDAGSITDRERVAAVAAELEATAGRLTLAALGVRPGRITLLRLRDRAAVAARMPAGHAEAWRALAVNVLQYGVLEPLLGIDAAALAAGEQVEFSEDVVEAAGAVAEGHAPLAFLVPATRADEIIAVADAGDRMPQKSTYFYPKLGTGLVLNALDVE